MLLFVNRASQRTLYVLLLSKYWSAPDWKMFLYWDQFHLSCAPSASADMCSVSYGRNAPSSADMCSVSYGRNTPSSASGAGCSSELRPERSSRHVRSAMLADSSRSWQFLRLWLHYLCTQYRLQGTLTLSLSLVIFDCAHNCPYYRHGLDYKSKVIPKGHSCVQDVTLLLLLNVAAEWFAVLLRMVGVPGSNLDPEIS
jgi:hypothetical protein